ncbi:CDP-diacylglycerol--glycerol-3-phosphate 3-phosphatidyltransferase [Blochmannia endosymbiont of Camponotus modoc]|uniref:CDP-diacylglycerol--glycerol-3-phosphate 3-phosphatidyltransferase n=1 Tax=Blochmannia endosymbiont of Camponotus modoc TaxID=2945587 RepID=UPI002023F526|nr:CDP-diacylglycerol--glycerol-3-phosphate 3-phosphatidyltransferase [Blochmannia endosymbiont of Camponotus modoc]URJ29660.1 CDP-diacylglycerol--glycerol-3-phosphate 3-phosphatidyltransferase [Blochmannia endosymbiont of Camponotus modoc]
MDFINIPTYLTLLRVIMVPFFTVMFYLPVRWAPMICTITFFVAAVTDWFDGFLARRWKQTTRFGKFLDPVADKVMIVAALVLIAEHFHAWWVTLPVSIIIIREMIILALREWVAAIGSRNGIGVLWISKIKTFVQMLALTALLWSSDEWIVIIGIVALYVSVLLTFWSMCQYLYIVRYDLFHY